MAKLDFDDYAENYREVLSSSIKISGQKDSFFDRYKCYCIERFLNPTDGKNDILDFGCGVGKLTGVLAEKFPESSIDGYDISSKAIKVAEKDHVQFENVRFFDQLPPLRKYNYIIIANVFHHIEPSEHVNTLNRLRELLKNDGKIVIFEHNPYNILTQYVVKSCPFDKDAKLLQAGKIKELAPASGRKLL